MKIGYIHKHCENDRWHGTVAVGLPTKSDLTTMLSTFSNAIALPVGLTKLHPKDQYVKATGRKLALSKMTTRVCEWISLDPRKGKQIFQFHTEIDGLELYIELSVVEHKEEVYLIHA